MGQKRGQNLFGDYENIDKHSNTIIVFIVREDFNHNFDLFIAVGFSFDEKFPNID